MVGELVGRKRKRPERGVFIEVLAETKSETYLVLSWLVLDLIGSLSTPNLETRYQNILQKLVIA
jgi:hypothetical protein